MNTSARQAVRLILVTLLAPAATAFAEGEPLHTIIDQQLAPVRGVTTQRCSDAEFLRRASLDLNGMPPTADEARTFIKDATPEKRVQLVDRLLASPLFARHLAATLDVMLMERRANTNISQDEWRAWLLKSTQDNKAWNVMAREILQADGDDPAQRAPARFALDRGSDPNLLTRDVGRIFFGRDMQCAQCHDHPIIDGYLQSDYHGLLAFLSPSYAMVRTENGAQKTIQGERAGTDLTFESVFVHEPRRTGPRIPDGVVIDEPIFQPGQEYAVAPADNVKAIPKFSRRAMLAELATNGSNQAFNRNIVNRLWGHMFGRGLVHPPDMNHPDNPPTHPQLLHELADHFVKMNFDMRAFLREIALSEAYQRSFDSPVNLISQSTQAAEEVTRLEEQVGPMDQAVAAASETFTKTSEQWNAAEAATLPVAAAVDTARTQYVDAKTKQDAAAKAAADANAQVAAKQAIATPVQQALTAAQNALKALPEDKVLSEAAQKLTTRSEQLTAETAALTKAAQEKAAAVPPASDVLAKAKPTMDDALAKLTPLVNTFKQAERAMLAARTKAAADAEARLALDRRIDTAKRVAQLPTIKQALVAATTDLPVREAAVKSAEKAVADLAATIAQNEQMIKITNDSLPAATAAVEATRTEHAKRGEVAQSIAAAFAAADAAHQKMPDDAVLAESVTKLKQRLDSAQAEVAELQKKFDAAVAAHQAATATIATAQKSLADAVAAREKNSQALAIASDALAIARTNATAKQSEYNQAVAELTERWTRDFTIAALKPLTPEQLCWTIFRVTGVYDRYRQTEAAELDKAKPLTEEQKKDAAQVASRNVELEQKTFDKLKDNVGVFVTFYGAAAGQPQNDFFSTVDQALFVANGGSINSWVAPAADNVTDRIAKQSDAAAAAEELYLALLTRMPTEDEKSDVVTYLSSRTNDKAVAAQELVWGLLNSAEFRFNH